MSYGDVNYIAISSGSTSASANTAHLLLGQYQGLSDLNNSEVVHMQLWAVTNNARVWDNTVTNNSGVQVGSTLYDYPPTRAGAASLLHFANETLGSNASIAWAVWRRAPL